MDRGFGLAKRPGGQYDFEASRVIVVLYVVLGRPNLPSPWVLDVADPAVKILRQNAQVLYAQHRLVLGKRSTGEVRQQPSSIVGMKNQTRLPL
jgi:hypothetical protein